MSETQIYIGWYETISQFFVQYSLAVFGALVTLAIGVFIARKISNWILILCQRHQVDVTLASFIASFFRIGFIVMVAIMALSKVGISVTPLLAAVGALSLGAGLAVQGLVSNYGAGLSIILTRTFVVGDTITVKDVCGVVTEIHLGYTILIDEDDSRILIPNRHIVGEIIKNTQQETLVELQLNIDYRQDATAAIEIMTGVIKQQELVNIDRTLNVGIQAFGEHAIVLGARFWAKSNTHISVEQQTLLDIYQAFKKANIEFAPPRLTVNLNHPQQSLQGESS